MGSPNLDRSRLRALQEVKGSWVEGFLAEKRTTTRRGTVPRESTIGQYAFHLNWIMKHGLDVKSASLSEIKKWLGDYQASHELATYANKVTIIKDALQYLKRNADAAEFHVPKPPDREERISKSIFSDDDIEKLIRGAPTLRDRLMIELFFELGSRRGELANVKIKDVQFDKYGAIIMLTGKTGTGPRRVYECVPDLREYLNQHPQKDDPNATLLMTLDSRPISYSTLYCRIRNLGLKILKRPIKPHAFRHTRATKDARYFTDREMMKLNRWKRPDMVAVYAHLSMRDVEDKDLVLHGLKAKEEILRPIMDIVKCRKCQADNAPIAIFCSKCGALLTSTKDEELTKLRKDFEQLKGQFETVMKTRITKEA